MSWLVCIVGSYLIGSIPYGYLLGLSRGIDVRNAGSGNIGATNVARLLGRRYGVICFLLDASKGATAVIASGFVNGTWGRPLVGPPGADTLSAVELWLWLAVAVAALLGHMYSPWLRFKGGKGIATGFGGMVSMWPFLTLPILLAFAIWVLVVRLTRYVSLASMAAAVSLPAGCLLMATMPGLSGSDPAGVGEHLWANVPLLLTTGALAVLVVYKHRTNIARLRAGTESKIGAPRDDEPTTPPEDAG